MHLNIIAGEISIRPDAVNEIGQLKSLAGRIKKGSVFVKIENGSKTDFIVFKSGNKTYKMNLADIERKYLEDLFKKNKNPRFNSLVDNILTIAF